MGLSVLEIRASDDHTPMEPVCPRRQITKNRKDMRLECPFDSSHLVKTQEHEGPVEKVISIRCVAMLPILCA
jgi:hypothetical protein